MIFLLDRNPQVSAAHVAMSEKTWEHRAQRAESRIRRRSCNRAANARRLRFRRKRKWRALSAFRARESGDSEDGGLRIRRATFKDRSQRCRRPRDRLVRHCRSRAMELCVATVWLFAELRRQDPGNIADCVCRSCQQIRATYAYTRWVKPRLGRCPEIDRHRTGDAEHPLPAGGLLTLRPGQSQRNFCAHR